MTSLRAFATLALLAAAGCTVVNDVERPCKDVPPPEALPMDGFISGPQPIARVRSGALFMAFRSGSSVSQTGSSIDATNVDPRDLGVGSTCPPGELARVTAAGGTNVDYAPSVAFAQEEPFIGALVYARQPGGGEAGIGGELRAAFMTPEGCSMATQDAVTAFSVDTIQADRIFTDPLIVHLREQTFALFWVSRALTFDDRLRGRLIQPNGRRFPANSGSTLGDAVDVAIGDRALGVVSAIALTIPATNARRVALLWNQQANRIVTTKLTLVDESLAIASPIVELGSDDSVTPDPGMRSISAAYDDASGVLLVAWNQGDSNASQIVARSVTFTPEAQLGPLVQLSDARDGEAYGPFVTPLTHHRFYVVWRVPKGVMGLSVSGDLKRNFDAYACNTDSYPLAQHPDLQVNNPAVHASDGALVVVYNRISSNALRVSSLGGVRLPLDGMFPGD